MATVDSARHPGATLADRYRLEAPRSGYGLGEAWSAHDREADRGVVVKFFATVGARSALRAAQLERAGDDLALVEHPNVLPLLDRGVSRDAVWWVYPDHPGEALGAWLTRRRAEGLPPLVYAGRLVDALAAGVGALHRAPRPMVHGGLSVDAVRIGPEGDPGSLKVLDPGVVDERTLSGPTADASLASVTAPELLRGAPRGPQSDVFALSVLALAMVAPEALTPRQGRSWAQFVTQREGELRAALAAFRSDADALFIDLLCAGLARQPGDRPGDAEALRGRLRAITWGAEREVVRMRTIDPVAAPQPTPPGPAESPGAPLQLPSLPGLGRPLGVSAAPRAVDPAEVVWSSNDPFASPGAPAPPLVPLTSAERTAAMPSLPGLGAPLAPRPLARLVSAPPPSQPSPSKPPAVAPSALRAQTVMAESRFGEAPPSQSPPPPRVNPLRADTVLAAPQSPAPAPHPAVVSLDEAESTALVASPFEAEPFTVDEAERTQGEMLVPAEFADKTVQHDEPATLADIEATRESTPRDAMQLGAARLGARLSADPAPPQDAAMPSAPTPSAPRSAPPHTPPEPHPIGHPQMPRPPVARPTPFDGTPIQPPHPVAAVMPGASPWEGAPSGELPYVAVNAAGPSLSTPPWQPLAGPMGAAGPFDGSYTVPVQGMTARALHEAPPMVPMQFVALAQPETPSGLGWKRVALIAVGLVLAVTAFVLGVSLQGSGR